MNGPGANELGHQLIGTVTARFQSHNGNDFHF
jgi:hypothetical protein